jgi:hypothetical protein
LSFVWRRRPFLTRRSIRGVNPWRGLAHALSGGWPWRHVATDGAVVRGGIMAHELARNGGRRHVHRVSCRHCHAPSGRAEVLLGRIAAVRAVSLLVRRRRAPSWIGARIVLGTWALTVWPRRTTRRTHRTRASRASWTSGTSIAVGRRIAGREYPCLPSVPQSLVPVQDPSFAGRRGTRGTGRQTLGLD